MHFSGTSPIKSRSGGEAAGPSLRCSEPITRERMRSSLYLIRYVVFALIGAGGLLIGCDPTVQVGQESDRHHYSMFGILNPAQDTQWVRVEPLAPPTTEGAPRDLGATVTLQNRRTGQTWTLRDSVMEVFPGEPQHNFWTTAPIAPGTSYRLVVRGDEGDSTWATTTTPQSPPTTIVQGAIYLPCLTSIEEANTFDVRVQDVERLAALRVRYFQTFGESVSYEFDWYEEVRGSGGEYVVQVNYLKNLRTTNRRIGEPCIADSGRVITAAGGPDWPEGVRYRNAPVSEVARPDSFTNVQGGLGMVAGVYTDTAFVPMRARIQ